MTIHSLFEVFGITRPLDITTRRNAGMFISGKVVIAKTHLQCIQEHWQHHIFDSKNHVAILHFLEYQDNSICCIDSLNFYEKKADTNLVAYAVLDQVQEIDSIYFYIHPDKVIQLY